MLSVGQELYDFAARLYPICRSITGNGLRQTLRLIGERVPLKIHEVPSGTRVFDWEVPLEWNIEDAHVTDPDGRRVVDFQAHNLHVMGYSEPVSDTFALDQLAPRLHCHARHADWIPYRTSYYRRNWGFCLRQSDRERLRPGNYRVEIKSSLARGALTYGELVVRGRSREEVLFFTHACHPSLANDNTSGMAIATQLAQWVASEPRRYTYRFVFAPVTIGSLCWLKRNERGLGRIRHGLVLGLLGDPAPLTYKLSRRENCEIDSIATHVIAAIDPQSRVLPFAPYGYDERQLCSPGFDLPVGRLTRAVNDGYPQYHSSADDLALIAPQWLEQSFEACRQIVRVMEGNARYVNLSPKGEPLLGKRGLYGSVGGRSPADREYALLWVLNQSDGAHSILDIARRSGVSFDALAQAATDLTDAGLLRRTIRGTATNTRGEVKRRAK
jgi:aminopeptidase-like protein